MQSFARCYPQSSTLASTLIGRAHCYPAEPDPDIMTPRAAASFALLAGLTLVRAAGTTECAPPSNAGAPCPDQFALSTPQPRAPAPELLGYRYKSTTGSFTDSEQPVNCERYRDFALKAATDDTTFATFRQVYS